MRLFLDTNVIVAAVTRDTERSETAVAALNEFDERYTSIINLMELRTVLGKRSGSNGIRSNRSNSESHPEPR